MDFFFCSIIKTTYTTNTLTEKLKFRMYDDDIIKNLKEKNAPD